MGYSLFYAKINLNAKLYDVENQIACSFQENCLFHQGP